MWASYSKRAEMSKNTLSKHLLQLMDVKRSNLCLSADVRTSEELLKLADTLGPYIVLFKTHADSLEDFTPEIVKELTKLAQKHKFYIFEDR